MINANRPRPGVDFAAQNRRPVGAITAVSERASDRNIVTIARIIRNIVTKYMRRRMYFKIDPSRQPGPLLPLQIRRLCRGRLHPRPGITIYDTRLLHPESVFPTSSQSPGEQELTRHCP